MMGARLRKGEAMHNAISMSAANSGVPPNPMGDKAVGMWGTDTSRYGTCPLPFPCWSTGWSRGA